MKLLSEIQDLIKTFDKMSNDMLIFSMALLIVGTILLTGGIIAYLIN